MLPHRHWVGAGGFGFMDKIPRHVQGRFCICRERA